MHRVCAWCSRTLGGDPGEAVVTHGICESCGKKLLNGGGRTLREFLESLDTPVVVVDREAVVVGVNSLARRVLGKDLEGDRKVLSGELIECTYASLPGGCGNTPHCPGCIVRSAIVDTQATGRGVEHVATEQKTIRGEIRLVISTEKLGDVVLLRIDRAEPTGRN
jgi:hypothetical protein